MSTVRLGEPGSWTGEHEVTVSRNQITAFALATNETYAPHLSGDVAPPMFATVPVRPAVSEVFALAMPEGLPPFVARLAGEQEMILQQPITAGMKLSCRASFLGFAPKSSGTTLSYAIQTLAAGSLVNEQYMVTFLKGVVSSEPAGRAAPSHSLSAEVWKGPLISEIVQGFDADQTFRYSAASGDRSRWHLDEDVAKAAGLPGIIIHGHCSMAFAARAIADCFAHGDTTRIERFAVRFSNPVCPGDAIRTTFWQGSGPAEYLFQTRDRAGSLVLTNGVAKLR